MIEQNSAEWLALRAGKITASRAKDVLAFSKRDGKPLQARVDYAGDILAELLTGEPRAQVRAAPLDWGHDVEAAARAAYEAETGEMVVQIGFVQHPLLPYVGCSPDGLIGGDGMLQIKCPHNPAVHAMTWREGMPDDHVPQIQFELWVTGRAWSDFVSYDPRMPAHRRLYIQRISRAEKLIEHIAESAASLWAEVQSMYSEMMKEAA